MTEKNVTKGSNNYPRSYLAFLLGHLVPVTSIKPTSSFPMIHPRTKTKPIGITKYTPQLVFLELTVTRLNCKALKRTHF